jgi:hypothetical protein
MSFAAPVSPESAVVAVDPASALASHTTLSSAAFGLADLALIRFAAPVWFSEPALDSVAPVLVLVSPPKLFFVSKQAAVFAPGPLFLASASAFGRRQLRVLGWALVSATPNGDGDVSYG